MSDSRMASNSDDSALCDPAKLNDFDLISTTFHWTINNFERYNPYLTSAPDTFPFIYSQNFSPFTNFTFCCNLELCPRGESEKWRDFVSLFLYVDSDTDDQIQVDYKISIVDKSGQPIYTKSNAVG